MLDTYKFQKPKVIQTSRSATKNKSDNFWTPLVAPEKCINTDT
jgi:hypothetical protein